MEYAKYYKEASQIADQIRSGGYQKGEVSDGSGLIKRPKPKPAEESPQRMLVDYMTQIGEAPVEDQVNPDVETGTVTMGTPVVGEVGAAREALASIESSGNYDAMGPVMKSGQYKGQRAVGKYQVMEGNIGPWTKAILGKSMSTEEFLNDHSAQDKVVEGRLQQSYDKHGSWEDAASIWFSGRPVAKAGNASDGYTTVPEYINRFQTAFNSTTTTDTMGLSTGKPIMKPRAR